MSDEQNEIEVTVETQETFSFFDVLEGVTYPEDEVTVSIDESAAYELGKIVREIDGKTQMDEAEVEEYTARVKALEKRIEDSKFTFYLKGVADDIVASGKDVADGRFESKKVNRKNAQGHIERVLPESENLDYIRFLNAVVLALHVTSILERRTGRVMTAPTADEMAAFFDKAPGAAKDRLSQAIGSLRVASNQYEASLDEGFFPKP